MIQKILLHFTVLLDFFKQFSFLPFVKNSFQIVLNSILHIFASPKQVLKLSLTRQSVVLTHA